MNASVAIQVLPNVQDEEEVIRIVDEVIAYIRSTGLNYYVGPFETTIEGDYDQLMDIVKECQHVAERAGCKAMSVYVKIAYTTRKGMYLPLKRKLPNITSKIPPIAAMAVILLGWEVVSISELFHPTCFHLR